MNKSKNNSQDVVCFDGIVIKCHRQTSNLLNFAAAKKKVCKLCCGWITVY